MRALGIAAMLLAAFAASAGELPGGPLRPGAVGAEGSTIARVRAAADMLMAETVDPKKLGALLGSQEIRRTEDKSPMRPNEQVYFASTEQIKVIRLSVERDKRWASANPHSLYLTLSPFANLTLTQMDLTFGAARPSSNLSPRSRAWVYAPMGKPFVAQLLGDFAAEPQRTTPLSTLQIRIDRR